MIISYHGLGCFRIQFGELVVGVNPFSSTTKKIKKLPRFGADIGLVSLLHDDFNGVDSFRYGEKKPFVIDTSGEYEIKGVLIKGFETESQYGSEKSINTSYVVSLEDMKVTILGALSNIESLKSEAREKMEETDILFVTLGPGFLSAEEVSKIAVKVDAKIVIPGHTDDGALKEFLMEEGIERSKPADKATIKKRDLEGKEGEVVILKQDGG